MSKISKSLSTKLGISIIVLAMPTFILSLGIFYLQSRYLIHHEAVERSRSVLHTAIQRVNNFMNTIEYSTSANAWLLEESFTPESMEAVTHRIVNLNPNVSSCYVSAAPNTFPQYGQTFSVYSYNAGDTIVTSRETDFDYLSKDWYKKSMLTDEAFWIEPFSEWVESSIDYNDAVAAYCRPLHAEDGRITGIITTEFSFNQLAKSIASMEHSYPDAYFILLGADGRFFIHPNATRLFRKTIFTDADPKQNADIIALGHQMTGGKQGIMHVMVGKQKCHVNYQPVPGTNWSLAMVCPENEILLGYHRLAYVIAALIIIGLLAILWLTNKVVRQSILPIRQLLAHTQLIADGEYNDPIPQTSHTDDIGRLQNSFSAMQQALHDHMGSIRHAAEKIQMQNEERARNMERAEDSIKKKTTFIQNLSHQIRTPLNVITGFSNVILNSIMLREKGKTSGDKYLEEEQDIAMGMMQYNAIHLKRMVLMLFDSSSAGSSQHLMGNRKDEISCNDIARESIGYTKEHFKGMGILFTSDLPDGTHILTNRLYLTRTIRELLYNAAKFSDGEHIHLHVSQTDTTVNFIIEDTGSGLPDNADELLYKPFVKIDDLSEGLGLGLPLCKRHALSLGGDLIYDKDYHDGCRFILEMPK